MKSYKDIDREIILNAPEGAMWYNYKNDMYYTYNGEGVVYFSRSGGWSDSSAWFDLSKITEEPDAGDLIPLPNIEIPWVATADSVCPVPDGCGIKIKTDSGWVPGDYTTGEEDVHGIVWSRCGNPILAYKIIDEYYLKPAQEEPIHVPELEMHRAAYQAIKNAGFESPEELLAEYRALREEDDSEVVTSEVKLFRSLKFLQNLANEFPEIADEVVAEMRIQFECYCEEKLND